MNSTLLFGPKTELTQMLAGRERRAAFQEEMLGRNEDAVLVCFTVNAPGAVKVNAVTEIIFAAGVSEIERALRSEGEKEEKWCKGKLPGVSEIEGVLSNEGKQEPSNEYKIIEQQVQRHSYGHEAYYVVKATSVSAADQGGKGPEKLALLIKSKLIKIEESHPLGRLFDIDVIYRKEVKTSGEFQITRDCEKSSGGAEKKKISTKISREDLGEPARKCLLCGKPASECASTRAHSVDELCEHMKKMVVDYVRNAAAKNAQKEDRESKQNNKTIDTNSKAFEINTKAIGTHEQQINTNENIVDNIIRALAYSAMLAEVATTPKPGLVDAANNGAHSDMNPMTFEKSAAAIEGYFAECFAVGEEMQRGFEVGDERQEHFEISKCNRGSNGSSEKASIGRQILKVIRPLGQSAEAEMLKATGGINTHKGLIFSLGIICAAYGYVGESAGYQEAFEMAGQIAEPTLEDFKQQKNNELSTSGEKQYGEYGITGIRGEAAGGFPGVRDQALPTYKEALAAGLSCNDAGVLTLLRLISCVRDSNMISRGGVQLSQEMSIMAGHLVGAWKLAERVDPRPDALIAGANKLDEMFIKKNLSPGGCADMLAITYFIDMLRELFAEEA